MRWTTRQDALLATAALAGGAVMLAAHSYIHWPGRPDPGPLWRAIPLLGVCAAMLFRRTAPMATLAIATPAVVADAVLGTSFPTVAIFTDALYAAALYGPAASPRRLLTATGAVTLALTGVISLLDASSPGTIVTNLASLALVLVVPVLTAIVVREHRDRAEAERVRAEQAAQLAEAERVRAEQVARLAELDRREAVADERARMARELHDVIANHLSAAALHSSALLSVPDMDAAAVRRALEVIRENSVQGLAEMRRMIGLLRGSEGTGAAARPRLDDVTALVERTRRDGLTTRLTTDGEPAELPAAVELAAYRIVQESLTNVVKHAGDGEAAVAITHGRDAVTIVVDSPLGGRTGILGTGTGLIGMRERASLLGGSFTAGRDGGRWRVHARLPVSG
ncbi:sensor histidine kinase [Actinoallomurus sp. CA-150999]|uniref:sensor histidine kinase n=1 Tax=Actinoallomurus sp. CA-150999 TaxID=3239887 RepID=UPI003D94DFE3